MHVYLYANFEKMTLLFWAQYFKKKNEVTSKSNEDFRSPSGFWMIDITRISDANLLKFTIISMIKELGKC